MDLPGTGTWATFFLDREMYAIAVEEVLEVMRPQSLTPVPLAPAHIAGLLNLRGQVIPVMLLRKRLRRPPREAGTLLVLRGDGAPVGLLVDEIGDVIELPGASWRPPPHTLSSQYRDLVFGVCPIPGHVVMGLRAGALEDARASETSNGGSDE